MTAFQTTSLWSRTLADQANDQLGQYRERLRASFLSLRERAAMLAAEIARDLPDYTVHDVTHLDALWRIADLAGGPDLPLNPAEAFVLGGAFLIHDLGNGLAAYPEGIAAMRASAEMRDSIATILRARLGRAPSLAELGSPGSEVEREATGNVLRALHAQQAERLALVSWKDPASGLGRFLIEDIFMRETYGSLIGRIAHSHWWPIDKVRQEFDFLLGAPVDHPPQWTVDPLKIACLLRVADAGHLDGSRAPAFLRTIRRPAPGSSDHWIFQEKLQQPILNGDRLTYTSARPFTATEAAAWWLCFDALQMLDRELTGVDAVLADCSRQRFAARGVQGAEDPNRLTRWVQPAGWIPVDTRIRVTDVAALAAKLGGVQLYGDNRVVPLRELVQNGSDAVRARRFLEDRSADFGRIAVRTGEDAEGHWVEIEDNGVGMTKEVLSGPLLDFGESFWGSQRMVREFPGLAASGFESTGKYGIGFFSIFMWGQHVRVTSRSFRDAQRETHILEFSDGLRARPLLRSAGPSEFLKDGGTVTRVWVESRPDAHGGVFHLSGQRTGLTLGSICEWLCPALDANLYVQRTASEKRVVAASDWKMIDGRKLLNRIWHEVQLLPESPSSRPFPHKEWLGIAASNLRDLRDDAGGLMGRAAIIPVDLQQRFVSLGCVTVGGLRACDLRGIAGILEGSAYSAARDAAIPVVSMTEFAAWASGQARLVRSFSPDPEVLADCAKTILACGGSTGDLPIAETADGWRSIDQIHQWGPLHDEILLLQDAALSIARREKGSIELEPNVVACDVGWRPVLDVRRSSLDIDWPYSDTLADDYWSFHDRTVEGAVVKLLASVWKTSPEEVIAASDISSDEKSFERKIGIAAGQPVTHSVDIFRNPHKIKTRSGRRRK